MKAGMFVESLFFFAAIACATLHAGDLGEPPWVYKGRGDRYFQDGQTGKAIVEYKNALAKRKEEGGAAAAYPEVNLQLAKIYLLDGLHDLAYTQIETAQKYAGSLQIAGLVYEIQYTKAEILEGQKKSPESIYRDIIEGDGGGGRKPDGYWLRYRNASLQKSILEAGKLIEDGAYRTKYAKAHFELGRIKYQEGNFINAIPFLEMALLYRYKPEQALRYLVDAYKNEGNIALARKVPELYGKMK